jgi:hypothetical protein
MSLYSPPKVDVNVLPNPRIINIAGEARLPAIVGIGPTVRVVVDESVQRGVGGIDYLSAYPSTNVVITKVAKRSGLNYTSGSSSNDPDAIPGLNGSLYLVSGSIPPGGVNPVAGYFGSNGTYTNGAISWNQEPAAVTTGSVPATGSVYFVTYQFDVPASQFLPQVFSDKQSLINTYGNENNTSGSLTVAASIALENGAPAVVVCQVSGSLNNFSVADYRNAIDKLRKKSAIEEIIAIFPSGSLPTATFRNDVQTYLFQHTQLMNLNRRWRGMYYGVASPYYNPTESFDLIGDESISNSYVGKAKAFSHEDVVLIAPSVVWRFDADNKRMELDSAYAACAVAGVHSAQPLRSIPITGFVVTGINIEEDKWDTFQMDTLGAGGVLVLQNIGGVITIRDAITTDSTSANTQEISVVSQRRLVERTLSEKLFEVYTNKGKTINPSTVRDVEATTRSILNSLRQAGEIFGYGVKDDPNTGETKITAIQDVNEPRRINVTCSIKYLYPMKFLSVTVSTFV